MRFSLYMSYVPLAYISGGEPTARVPEVALIALTVGTRTVASVQGLLSER